MQLAGPGQLSNARVVAIGTAVGVVLFLAVFSPMALTAAVWRLMIALALAFLVAAGAWLGLTHATVRLADANAYVEYPRNEFDRMRIVQCVIFGVQFGVGLVYTWTLVWMALNTAALFFLWFHGYVQPTMRRSMA